MAAHPTRLPTLSSFSLGVFDVVFFVSLLIPADATSNVWYVSPYMFFSTSIIFCLDCLSFSLKYSTKYAAIHRISKPVLHQEV